MKDWVDDRECCRQKIYVSDPNSFTVKIQQKGTKARGSKCKAQYGKR